MKTIDFKVLGTTNDGKILIDANDVKSQMQSQYDAINALQAERNALACAVNNLRMAIQSNCHDDPSTSGKRLIELAKNTPQHHLAAHDAEVAEKAVNEFCEWMFLSKRYSVAEWCGEFTSQLRAKAKQ